MQGYNQSFNKYALSFNLGGIKNFLGNFKSLAKVFPWLAAKSSRVVRDAKKVKDVAGKTWSTTKDFGKDVMDAASSPYMLPIGFGSAIAANYIDAGIKDFANTYEGVKAIEKFNEEFEKAYGQKPSFQETASYIAQLQKRNQELKTADGNKKQTTELKSPSTPQADKFEIGKLFDISSPYAQYLTLPTAAGATLGGLLYGGKGSAIGGASGLGLGLLAKYIADSQATSASKPESSVA